MIESGAADLRWRHGYDGGTALHHAVKFGEKRLVDYLSPRMDAESLRVVDNMGKTAQYWMHFTAPERPVQGGAPLPLSKPGFFRRLLDLAVRRGGFVGDPP